MVDIFSVVVVGLVVRIVVVRGDDVGDPGVVKTQEPSIQTPPFRDS